MQHQYRLTDESGPAHKKTFTVCLKIGDTEEYVASGPSIKKAQHAAAAISLEKTQFKHPSPKSRNIKNANITPTVELNALAMKRGEPTTYTFLEPGSVRSAPGQYRPQYGQGRGGGGGPGYPPQFAVQLRVGVRDFFGEGPTAQAAKHGAAGKALKALRDMPVGDGKSKLDPTSLPFIPGSEYDELKSPISLAHEIALKRNLTVYFEVRRVNLCVLITLSSIFCLTGGPRNWAPTHENICHKVCCGGHCHRGRGQRKESEFHNHPQSSSNISIVGLN